MKKIKRKIRKRKETISASIPKKLKDKVRQVSEKKNVSMTKYTEQALRREVSRDETLIK
ncbi:MULTISPECIES: hypothetical protein [Bacillus cereus group]|uniref:hypothetical protein n=1 Tax=Bacillus cereus group TaxID=86661 RepID=UPI001588CF0A|nr:MULTISPECIES: hypothetical protein [Bacillus cereus group]MED4388476.1 hypothetical protein [Bacillus mobilis]